MKHTAPPAWLTVIAWTSLAIAFASAALIAVDIFVRGHRQKMAIMNAVWPINALYLGPFAVWFYRSKRQDERWAKNTKGVMHCGAGCTLGDIGAEWLVFAIGLTMFGREMYPDFIFDFAFAWALGIVFQYFTIAPMRGLPFRAGVVAAVRADTLSIVAFQVGLFASMAVYNIVIFSPPLAKTTAAYWFLMQIAMVIGAITALPVNAWLIRKGWKEAM